MLKRLLGRLTKKADPAPEQLITAYDAQGRELRIPRGEWRDKVLGPNLRSAWDDPDELYRQILAALNDGFVAETDAPSARLLDIDPLPERGHTIRAIVMLQLGRLDEAEAVLQAGIERVGRSGTLLTNLAKVHAERGDHPRSEALLREAVQRDPNQENGLLWWAAIQRERDGEAGYLRALAEAAGLPGAWRPQLWLARHHLEQGEVGAARALYETVLSSGGYDSETLMVVSGDLGHGGQVELIPELIAPAFDPRRHDPRAGLNLLQAYLQLGRRQEGRALLTTLYALDLPPLKQHLDYFAAEFA